MLRRCCLPQRLSASTQRVDVDSDDECFGRAALAGDARAQVQDKKKQLQERKQQLAKRMQKKKVHPSPDDFDDDGGGGSEDGTSRGETRSDSKFCVVQ